MGDEGVGPAVVREIERGPWSLPEGVSCLDGGTGSFTLLGPIQEARRVVLIDACADGRAAGTISRIEPRFSSDYPPTLTAHDIGLKDLLDALYLLGGPPPVTLYAVTIEFPQPMGLGLGPELSAVVPEVARRVVRDVA
jgi:hydrogenase maturation protease